MSFRGTVDFDRQFDLELMEVCLDLARQAASMGEVPVGAIVVHKSKIIAKSHNLCERNSDSTAHAERLAITEAGHSLQTWRLDECTLYSTLEPCVMCAGAIVESRLSRLVYGATDRKAGACRSLYRLTNDSRLNHRVEVTHGILEAASSSILRDFFSDRR